METQRTYCRGKNIGLQFAKEQWICLSYAVSKERPQTDEESFIEAGSVHLVTTACWVYNSF